MRSIVGVDEARGIVYFMANARETGEDPYYQHLYRVNLDGTGIQLLDPGDLDHRTSMGESNRFFVDNVARVNSTPTSALFDTSGRKIEHPMVNRFFCSFFRGRYFTDSLN